MSHERMRDLRIDCQSVFQRRVLESAKAENTLVDDSLLTADVVVVVIVVVDCLKRLIFVFGDLSVELDR